jgi:phosphoglycerate dehydrogenase-like enzyme
MAKHRCAILDDYQSVALKMADWSKVMPDLDIKVFSEPMGSPEEVARALQGFAIVVAMRERTPFPRQLIEALPDLRLLITTGMVNRAIDLDAAKARNVVVCGTPSFGNPTTGIAWGLILELTRRIGHENARLKGGALWQSVVGADVEGLTLGVIGLGKLALRVAEVGRAFRMKVVAWSQNITPERAQAAGVDYAASKEDVLRQADIVSIHIPLTPKSRGLIGATELGLMKPTAFLVNTSRGPIVDEGALLAALHDNKIAGAGLDVYDVEPLPLAHPLRTLDNVVLTPHLGYASQQNYRAYFAGVVDDIRGFLDGKPVRVLTATA